MFVVAHWTDTKQDLLYVSIRFCNNITVLAEVKIPAVQGSTNLTVRLPSTLPLLTLCEYVCLFPSSAHPEDNGHGCDSWSSGGV